LGRPINDWAEVFLRISPPDLMAGMGRTSSMKHRLHNGRPLLIGQQRLSQEGPEKPADLAAC
jgi:hypothetical protein